MSPALFVPIVRGDLPRARAYGHFLDLRRVLPVAVATLAVIASLGVAPQAARAAEVSIADSIAHGTVEQDIVSGRISVDQLTDSAVAARSGAPDLPPMSRSEVMRQMTEEVQALRTQAASDSTGVEAQDAADAGASVDATDVTGTAVGDGVAASKFSLRKAFRKIKHFFQHAVTVNIPLWKAVLGNGAIVTVTGLAALACASVGVLSCAVVAAFIAGSSSYVFLLLNQCVKNRDRTWHLTIPDVIHSWCSK
ncbi:hypothetical protein [Clavibacter michiganensis]|uniref:Uncharacterized protein n=1 Tax=Clavibacter michiganensis subsp. insidiosus TaxID=33014 RepID=A0A0D5CN96_9MICO|nr:hypothetical protein [Clavibacter michiganensis]AJW80762.1 hypothetical protein VO01_16165 [Clavibacter michiganensis subsp. insidiosus]AWF99968.1 hypothetical protein BEH61_15790 [Clavibacter michiganensis subsp. insidiosus]